MRLRLFLDRRKREGQKIDFKQKADLKILSGTKFYIPDLLVTDGGKKCGNSGNLGEGSYTDRGNRRPEARSKKVCRTRDIVMCQRCVTATLSFAVNGNGGSMEWTWRSQGGSAPPITPAHSAPLRTCQRFAVNGSRARQLSQITTLHCCIAAPFSSLRFLKVTLAQGDLAVSGVGEFCCKRAAEARNRREI